MKCLKSNTEISVRVRRKPKKNGDEHDLERPPYSGKLIVKSSSILSRLTLKDGFGFKFSVLSKHARDHLLSLLTSFLSQEKQQ